MDKKLLEELTAEACLKDQYERQLQRMRAQSHQTDCVEQAVDGVMNNLGPKGNGTRALVIYGDPQSGKTEMMICLTARLLDTGHQTIVHLLNDNVALLNQNLERFKLAGLAPAPRSSGDLAQSPLTHGHAHVLFCKKNARDLARLIQAFAGFPSVVVVDDEADYATPNSRVNRQQQTKINELVSDLLGADGIYIGVTATPARLNLNNTFENSPETWVHFRPHDQYTGQEDFFPADRAPQYRLVLLDGTVTPDDARRAFARFLVTVARLNIAANAAGGPEKNYTFLVHTSGRTADHDLDRRTIEQARAALLAQEGEDYKALVQCVYEEAARLYPDDDPRAITRYVLQNASRSSFVTLNSRANRSGAGDRPTVPTCPFTVIIGGNIVSRGVTFPNLLAMFFTRDVKTKLQQDTYIQRARMFGARGPILRDFELTIPRALYRDWLRNCNATTYSGDNSRHNQCCLQWGSRWCCFG